MPVSEYFKLRPSCTVSLAEFDFLSEMQLQTMDCGSRELSGQKGLTLLLARQVLTALNHWLLTKSLLTRRHHQKSVTQSLPGSTTTRPSVTQLR